VCLPTSRGPHAAPLQQCTLQEFIVQAGRLLDFACPQLRAPATTCSVADAFLPRALQLLVKEAQTQLELVTKDMRNVKKQHKQLEGQLVGGWVGLTAYSPDQCS